MVMNNDMYTSHVGYEDSGFDGIRGYFSDDTLFFIQQKVTELLRGEFPQGVIVTCPRIREVMNAVFRNYQPPTGDIYSRYTITAASQCASGTGNSSYFNMVNDMINQVVTIIVTDVQNNLGIENNNSKLDIWDSILGDGNRFGMRGYSTPKINNKRPPLLFNMVY